MIRRLVLGSGPLCATIIDELAAKSGTLTVVTDDKHFAESVREKPVELKEGDPTDEEVLRSVGGADIIAVAGTDAGRNRDMAESVRRVFPGSYLLAYAGTDPCDHGAQLEGIVDTVLDRGEETAERIMEGVGAKGARMRQLWGLLREFDSLAVMTHDNPDPDAIASGVALAELAEAADCAATVCYYGEITHQENRAFVNLLDLKLRNLDDNEGTEAFDGVALVDHSRPGVNDQLAEGTPVDIVIDHHPPRAPVDARFVDLRSDVGATSTLLVDYLEHFDVGMEGNVPTALLFGIHIDTDGFAREVSTRDFEAAAKLVSHADLGTLERIESPTISARTLETVARAIQNRRQEGSVLTSCVGELSERDALAQAADRLLTIEGITTTLVYGLMDDSIYASARSRGTAVDLGETMRDAFDQIGSAGGHTNMAGAQIQLGMLDESDDREALTDIVETVIANRFIEALGATGPPTGVGYGEQDITKAFIGTDELTETGEPVPRSSGGTEDRDEDSKVDGNGERGTDE